MKKIFLMAVAAMLLAAPAVQAQKVNSAAEVAKLEKSDAEIQDAKKNIKSATWVKRAQTMASAFTVATAGIYETMNADQLKAACGEPMSVEVVKIHGGAEAEAKTFGWITVFVQNGAVKAWTHNKEVRDGLYEDFMEAVNKAYELDAKSASKLKPIMANAQNHFIERGNVNYEAGLYHKAAEAYKRAYEIVAHPAYGAPADPNFLFNAGQLYVFAGVNDAKYFVEAEQCLRKAIEAGYTGENGDVYYYLYHACYGQTTGLDKESDERAAILAKAKSALTEGVEKFPTNQDIISALLNLYMAEPTVGNPAELIDMIKAAIERNPESVDMWTCLALANYQMKNHDDAIAAGAKAVALAPELYDTNYRQGIFWATKGDALGEEMNKKSYTRQADYDADYAVVNDAYRAAIPFLEKAHSLQPANVGVVETLKSLCFRLRDEEGMMDKYNVYNSLLKEMK